MTSPSQESTVEIIVEENKVESEDKNITSSYLNSNKI